MAQPRLWDVGTGQPVGEPLVGLRGAVLHVRFGATARQLVTASATGGAVWNLGGEALSRRAQIAAPPAGSVVPDDVAFSPNGRELATVDGNGRVSLLDASTLEPQGESIPTAGGGVAR